MATHVLTADTRMEDLGLASGDTIALNGFVLTCETDLSAITGLYATGSGTIRLLDGGNADFSGSNPLPADITIEGGTEETPLPAHGDYGYEMRSSACIKVRASAKHKCSFLTHCVGNWNRPQCAKILSISGNVVYLDSDMELEPGDEVTSNVSGNSRYFVSSYNQENNAVTLTSTSNLAAGNLFVLVTAGFCVFSSGYLFIDGDVIGDEIGAISSHANASTPIFLGALNIERIACAYRTWTVTEGVLRNASGKVGTFCTGSVLFGVDGNGGGCVTIGRLYAAAGICGDGSTGVRTPSSVYAFGGMIGNAWAGVPTGVSELVDVDIKNPIYNTLSSTAELTLRTTGDVPTCAVHRAGGIATLVQRADFTVPTSLPNAWLLTPIDDGTAWHDEPVTVRPGETLTIQWYGFLGDEAASMGVQILDGDCAFFGQVAVPMGAADVLAEYTVPEGTEVLQWLPEWQVEVPMLLQPSLALMKFGILAFPKKKCAVLQASIAL